MLSALQLLAIIRRTGKSLSDLADIMIPLPQVLLNVRVSDKRDVMELPKTAALLKDIEAKLGQEGRILIRYSGTEPLLRIMIEGQDKYQITAWAKEIADSVEKTIGVK
jgi:phosphoglucosamine mutase